MESNNQDHTKESTVMEVIKDIASRAEVGIKKYNKTMDRDDLSVSDWVQHAYEEALDLTVYLCRLKKDVAKLEARIKVLKKTECANEKSFLSVQGSMPHQGINISTGGIGSTTGGYTITSSSPIQITTNENSESNLIVDPKAPIIKKRYANHR